MKNVTIHYIPSLEGPSLVSPELFDEFKSLEDPYLEELFNGIESCRYCKGGEIITGRKPKYLFEDIKRYIQVSDNIKKRLQSN